jgi:DNA-binding NarL/FixJ family response regulator
MSETINSTLDDKFKFLNRLCSGRSPLICQYNLLVELQPLLHWEQVVLLGSEPWILPLNEHVLFNVPEQSCPTGLWQWESQSDLTLPFQNALPPQDLPKQSHALPKAWCDWCHAIAHHYQFLSGALMMIDISLGDTQNLSCQVPIVILRNNGAFNEAEIATLRMVHDALQQIVDQALILENLRSHSTVEPEVSATSDSFPLFLDDRSEPCIEKCLQKLGLTPRQVEVMHMIIKGKELTAIAHELGCTEATVRKHVENLYRRLGVQTRTAAIAQVLDTIGIA